jgi:hypothetical protein
MNTTQHDLNLLLALRQPRILSGDESLRSLVLEKRLLAAAESSSACSKPTSAHETPYYSRSIHSTETKS